jgi:hypothetical protein
MWYVNYLIATAGALECGSGRSTASELATSALQNSVTTLIRSGNIGPASDRCATSATPTDDTFGIWGIIYMQTPAMYVPGLLEDVTRWHLMKSNEASQKWVHVFTGDDANQTRAKQLLETVACHLAAVRQRVCTTASSRFLCCIAKQYETWVRFASIAAHVIVAKYGDRCGLVNHITDAEVDAMFDAEFSALASSAESSTTTLAWAYRGVTDARNGIPPSVTCNGCSDEVRSALIASRTRWYWLLRADLICRPW